MNPGTICKHLRAKRMFIPALAQQPASQNAGEPSAPNYYEEPADTCHCWCNATLTEVGPDDQAAGFQTCLPARACFEA